MKMTTRMKMISDMETIIVKDQDGEKFFYSKESVLNEMAKEIYEENAAKGFHEKETEFGTRIALIHSELSEALEADRKGSHANVREYIFRVHEGDDPARSFEQLVKDTVEDEIADAIIRILDLCATEGINIAEHIKLKREYNSHRPYKHGKKY